MTEAVDLSIDDIQIGLTSEWMWQVEEAEIDGFADLSGDRNPLHMDNDYAKGQGFPGRVAHGFLLGAKLSGLIGMQLPGRRCLLLEQKLAYPNAVHAGDTVRILATVKECHEALSVIVLTIKATVDREGKTQTVGRGAVTCKILP